MQVPPAAMAVACWEVVAGIEGRRSARPEGMREAGAAGAMRTNGRRRGMMDTGRGGRRGGNKESRDNLH